MNETAFLLQHCYFTTREFAFLCDCSLSAASRKLGVLGNNDVIKKVTRSIWAQPVHRDFTVNGAIGYLLGNERGYLSFLSALHIHGAIAQIPTSVQIATTGHGRILMSSIGRFEFFKIKPELMLHGTKSSETSPPYPLAQVEKALLDTLYISSRRSKRFSGLPELDKTIIDNSRLAALIQQQQYPAPIANAVARRLRELSLYLPD